MRETLSSSIHIRNETIGIYIIIGLIYISILSILWMLHSYIQKKEKKHTKNFTKNIDEIIYNIAKTQYKQNATSGIRAALKEKKSYIQWREETQETIQTQYPDIYKNTKNIYRKIVQTKKIWKIVSHITAIMSLWISILLRRN